MPYGGSGTSRRPCLGADGKPIYDANGKFLKGPNYWKGSRSQKSKSFSRPLSLARIFALRTTDDRRERLYRFLESDRGRLALRSAAQQSLELATSRHLMPLDRMI
jgi:hypothetical protein